MTRLITMFWLSALTLLAACGGGAATGSDQPVLTRTVGEYRLGAGDELRIEVFGEDQLSDTYQVDGSGVVSFALIGEVPAAGKTVRQLERDIETRLRDGFLREPRVNAEVLSFRPYYILGEVGKPGEYPYTEGMSVLNAVATAEGFSYRANKKVVLIQGANDAEPLRVELSPTTRVMPGDTITVIERYF